MRSRKALMNMTAAMVELIVITVTSFVVPHYIIGAYGSSVNGLLASITQFLSYIALIESGIGAIGRASLYKPLADHNQELLSRNTKALENFYRRIAYIFLVYLAVLAVLFPLLVTDEFDWPYVVALVVILGLSTFVQYYFGITYQTLVQADQRKYIPMTLNSLTQLTNMLITVMLIQVGAGVHTVKIVSTAAFAIRPLFLYFYAMRHYALNRNAAPNNSVLAQRWDGLAQHISFFVHKNTDIAVLTVMCDVREVSVYSVYMLAVNGCAKLVNLFTAGLEPAFGNMIARGEKKTLEQRVEACSILTIQAAVVCFSTATIVLMPFISLYTRNVTDTNYFRPVFGLTMLVAEGMYCIRLPYQAVVYASGHFRQTRNGAIAEAVINFVLSITLVPILGIEGVAIGTLVAMTLRTVQYIHYYYHVLLKKGVGKRMVKMVVIICTEIALIALAANLIVIPPITSYTAWILVSMAAAAACFVIAFGFTYLFFRAETKQIFQITVQSLKRKRR